FRPRQFHHPQFPQSGAFRCLRRVCGRNRAFARRGRLARAGGIAGIGGRLHALALGWIGGGDAKLFAAVALWLGFTDMMVYALVASICGGALTLAILLLRQCPLPALLARQSWLLRLHDEHSGIPYGVALAAGAFLILPSTEIFRAAVAA